MASGRGQGGTWRGRGRSRCSCWGLAQSRFGPPLLCPCGHQPLPHVPHMPMSLRPSPRPPTPPALHVLWPPPRPLEPLFGHQPLPQGLAGPLSPWPSGGGLSGRVGPPPRACRLADSTATAIGPVTLHLQRRAPVPPGRQPCSSPPFCLHRLLREALMSCCSRCP